MDQGKQLMGNLLPVYSTHINHTPYHPTVKELFYQFQEQDLKSDVLCFTL